ncbi:MAG: hypothetical protein E7517_01900 [Ruminococcaceae bacterium]|nr:hypothetical protein [Oscillospiraceae bacterium]
MPDEIQNACILDEIKSTIRLGGFHHAVISSEFCEDFTHRKVDLIERTTHLNVSNVSFFLGGEQGIRTLE